MNSDLRRMNRYYSRKQHDRLLSFFNSNVIENKQFFFETKGYEIPCDVPFWCTQHIPGLVELCKMIP